MKTFFFDSIYNTQEFALKELSSEPIFVTSFSQEKGKGTSNREWLNSDQAIACSLALYEVPQHFIKTLIPLISGYSYLETVSNIDLHLKWPNDILFNDAKVGGILVEEKDSKICIGMGVNYFWENPKIPNASGIYTEKLDGQILNNHALHWGELTLNTIQKNSFDLSEYKKKLTTLGKLIEYPEGRGWARDVNIDGSLSVETISGEMINLTSPLISEVK